jgi:hypothetical protein
MIQIGVLTLREETNRNDRLKALKAEFVEAKNAASTNNTHDSAGAGDGQHGERDMGYDEGELRFVRGMSCEASLRYLEARDEFKNDEEG